MQFQTRKVDQFNESIWNRRGAGHYLAPRESITFTKTGLEPSTGHCEPLTFNEEQMLPASRVHRAVQLRMHRRDPSDNYSSAN